MRNATLFLAALCTVLAGCGGGGSHSTPSTASSLPQKATAGTAKLSIVLPKGLKKASIPSVHAPNHGLHKHGVVKLPKGKAGTKSRNRKPQFIDTTGANTFLQITTQSIQNGTVVASTTLNDIAVGTNTSLAPVQIPVYAGSNNIIVREVDETNGLPFTPLAQGQTSYSFTLGSGTQAVDIALSMVPAGVAILSSATDFPNPQQVIAGDGFPTINVSDFNNCQGVLSSHSVTITALPIDALGTLPNGDGAVPSVTLSSFSSDNLGQSTLTPTFVPGQYQLQYDAYGDGVTATFKSTDALNNTVITTADLTDTCSGGNGLSIATDSPEFTSAPDTIEFTSPTDSAAVFTPLELLAQGQVLPVHVTDDTCLSSNLVTYDTTSTFSGGAYTPVNITPNPSSGGGTCNITFSDPLNASVTLVVIVDPPSFSSPPPAIPMLSLSGPSTLNFTSLAATVVHITETATSPMFVLPSVVITDGGSCSGLLTVDSQPEPLSYAPTIAFDESLLTANGTVSVMPLVATGSCTLDFNDGVSDVQLPVTLNILGL